MKTKADYSGGPSVAGRLVALSAGVIMLWSYWPTLVEMAGRWSSDPRYSHGYLVPAFALYLLWHRRDMMGRADWRLNPWGLTLVAAGGALRLAGARYYFDWAAAASIVPMLAGLALVAGGGAALRWSWPAIVFLVFMIPLPYRVEYVLGYPLQRAATLASNYALQTIGLASVAEGNVILLGGGPKQAVARINVVEACNGLGMLFMFVAYAVGAVLTLDRGPLDKAVILISAPLIALGANVGRITLTGILHETLGGRVADAVYHDLAGWLMMPVALLVLWAECALLSRLFVAAEERPFTPAFPAAASPCTHW